MTSEKLEFEQLLIDAVREKPFLYNLKLEDYKDKDKKLNGWTQIGLQLHQPAKTCEDEWKKLRTQFTDYLRKINGKTGSGRKNISFRHADAMQFYRDTYHPHTKTITNLDETTFDETIIVGSQELEYDLEMEFDNKSTTNPFDSSQTTGQVVIKPKIAYGKRTKKMDEFETNFLEEYERKNKKDEFDTFCSSLAPKLRRVHEMDHDKALKLQIQILELISAAT